MSYRLQVRLVAEADVAEAAQMVRPAPAWSG
jgi:hypothetical protein